MDWGITIVFSLTVFYALFSVYLVCKINENGYTYSRLPEDDIDVLPQDEEDVIIDVPKDVVDVLDQKADDDEYILLGDSPLSEESESMKS